VRRVYTVLCFVFGVMLVTGCSDRDSMLQPEHAMGNTLPDISTSVSPATVEERRFFGDALITLAPNGLDIVVAVAESNHSASENFSDHLFLLQRDSDSSPIPAISTNGISLPNAQLHYNGDNVLVIQHPQLSVALFVEKSTATLSPELAMLQADNKWSGYGLVRTSGQWAMTVDGLAEGAKLGFACGQDGVPLLGGDGVLGDEVTTKRCTSGGEGASECTLGNCSVTCKDGYYACCCTTFGGCRCIGEEVVQ